MFRVFLRILAVLFLVGGLISSAIAGYLPMTPSEEDTLCEQKNKEMTEKYEQAQAARDPAQKARLLKESEEAGGWAQGGTKGARQRRVWHQLGLGAGVVVMVFSLIVLLLTFLGRRASTMPPDSLSRLLKAGNLRIK